MTRPIRILLIDDHPVVLEGYRRLLETEPDLEVVGQAQDAETGYRAFVELQPEVVVLDLSLPGAGGLTALRRIRSRDPRARVLVFSIHEDELFVQRALAAGARGYLTKRSAPTEMVQAVRAIASGGRYLGEGVSLPERSPPLEALTGREFEVFSLLAQGRTTQEIASLLHISPKTVGVHQTRIFHKLGASGPAQLTRLAIRHGIIRP